ncbi:MAG: hypothetical protein B7X76_10365, partial [Azorhizobium sp. 39-67-5]
LLASYPWTVLAVCSLLYLGFLPFSFLRYRRLMAAHMAETKAAPPASEL